MLLDVDWWANHINFINLKFKTLPYSFKTKKITFNASEILRKTPCVWRIFVCANHTKSHSIFKNSALSLLVFIHILLTGQLSSLIHVSHAFSLSCAALVLNSLVPRQHYYSHIFVLMPFSIPLISLASLC